jgi:UDP-galactopyranose mutase
MAGLEKFYPISTDRNKDILTKYKRLINTDKYIFGGRLAEYQYYDMHQVIASAMQRYKNVR